MEFLRGFVKSATLAGTVFFKDGRLFLFLRETVEFRVGRPLVELFVADLFVAELFVAELFVIEMFFAELFARLCVEEFIPKPSRRESIIPSILIYVTTLFSVTPQTVSFSSFYLFPPSA